MRLMDSDFACHIENVTSPKVEFQTPKSEISASDAFLHDKFQIPETNHTRPKPSTHYKQIVASKKIRSVPNLETKREESVLCAISSAICYNIHTVPRTLFLSTTNEGQIQTKLFVEKQSFLSCNSFWSLFFIILWQTGVPHVDFGQHTDSIVQLHEHMLQNTRKC